MKSKWYTEKLKLSGPYGCYCLDLSEWN